MIDYIEKNYPQELSLELLGEKFHMTGYISDRSLKKKPDRPF